MSNQPSPTSPSSSSQPQPQPPKPTLPRPYQPIPSPKSCSWSQTFSSRQISILRLGLLPQDMDDKWFVFSQEEGGEMRVHFIRSWSGDEFFEFVIEIGEGEGNGKNGEHEENREGGRVKELRFEGEKYELGDEEAREFCWALCGGVWDGFWEEGGEGVSEE